MAENSRGFHHPRQKNFEDEHMRDQSAMMPESKGRAGMKEPTNHAGHTHEMARRHEHAARVESMRNAHAGAGQRDHEKILHDTHRLHQGDGHYSHGSKHGAEHHIRGEHESAAERRREGE
jgi:hypothetical protein